MTPTLFEMPLAAPKHPARYTDALLFTFVSFLRGRKKILDPFGGTGKIFLLERWLPNAEIHAIEIEPEWAARHTRVEIGNALALEYPEGYFDAICTSPTYGNRMADEYLGDAKGSKRLTYSAQMGRALHPDNSGRLQWGPKYRTFHQKAWQEATRVLKPGGVFVLNIKDHIRGGKRMYVTNWHVECLEALGYKQVAHCEISVPSMGFGQNGDKRIPYEYVFKFQKK